MRSTDTPVVSSPYDPSNSLPVLPSGLPTLIAKTLLPTTSTVTTRIGFGTSRLHHSRTSRERQILLERAFDVGIRHFDTAPAYGHGLCERELGDFLQRHRQHCTIATKFGLPAAPWIDLLTARIRPFVRPAIAAQSLARRVGMIDDHRPALTAEGLERSVEASLQRLRTEHIDLHLLHEPALSRCRDVGALINKYHDLQARGLIAAFGIAGGYEDCCAFHDAADGQRLVVQTAEQEWAAQLVPDITYGVVSGGAQLYGRRPRIDDVAAAERIAAALARRPDGIVLVSTTKPARLDAIARTASAVGTGA